MAAAGARGDGSAGTTAARRLEQDQRALRLTKDDWVRALYGAENPSAAGDVIEGQLVEMHYFELEPAEQRRRLEQRHAEAPHTTWPMSEGDLATWATTIQVPAPGELDGTAPIDPPPVGFATWDAWRRHRWPPAVT